MSTIESIRQAAADEGDAVARAVELYQAGKLSADEFADDLAKAKARLDATVAAVPTPACPAWCTLPTGHPYEFLYDGEPSETVLARWHKRAFYNSQHLEVFVEAEERATAGGTVLGALAVCSIGELEQASAGEARVVASALFTAAGLLNRVGGA